MMQTSPLSQFCLCPYLPCPPCPTFPLSRSELKEEQGFHFVQVQDARALLDQAVDLLMDVVSREEDRMRDSVPGYKEHPYTSTLWRYVTCLSARRHVCYPHVPP